MSNWRRSPQLAALIVALYLTIQIAIPLSRIGHHDRSQRFGWQMFATVSDAPQFTVQTSTGTETVDLEAHLARVRGDLDLPELLPPFLCETVEGALSVSWEGQTYRCPTG